MAPRTIRSIIGRRVQSSNYQHAKTLFYSCDLKSCGKYFSFFELHILSLRNRSALLHFPPFFFLDLLIPESSFEAS